MPDSSISVLELLVSKDDVIVLDDSAETDNVPDDATAEAVVTANEEAVDTAEYPRPLQDTDPCLPPSSYFSLLDNTDSVDHSLVTLLLFTNDCHFVLKNGSLFSFL